MRKAASLRGTVVTFYVNGLRCLLDLQDALQFVGLSLCVVTGKYLRVNRMEQEEKLVHRIVMGLERDDARAVDHVNGDRLDNRRCNLRFATMSENNANKRARPDNTCGVTGVYWDPARSRWTAHICVERTRLALGRFVSFADAVAARRSAEDAYQGGFAARHGVQRGH